MKIGGFLKTSYSDFPGQLSSIVFTSGCNFKCAYCHNGDLARGIVSECLTTETVYEELKSRRQHIRAVVVSGGEPTLDEALIDFVKGLKFLDFQIKLDTNGSNPKLLDELINQKLIDYVAMDFKGKLEDYEKITGYSKVNHIKESIQILLGNQIESEFRTTILSPYHNLETLKSMYNVVKGSKRWYWQQYQYSEHQIQNIHFETYERQMLEKFKMAISECGESVGNCEISIRAKR